MKRKHVTAPLCNLTVFRQQTWQEIVNYIVAVGLWMWDSCMRFPSLA